MRCDKSMSDTPSKTGAPDRIFIAAKAGYAQQQARAHRAFLRTALPLLAVALTVGTLSWTVTSTDDTPTRETAGAQTHAHYKPE